MGICSSCTRGAAPKFQCEACSKPYPYKSRKPNISCLNGHTVCQLCMFRTGNQFHCPHCKTLIPETNRFQANQHEEGFGQKKSELTVEKYQKIQTDKSQQIHHFGLNEEVISGPKNLDQAQPQLFNQNFNNQAKVTQQSKKNSAFQQVQPGFNSAERNQQQGKTQEKQVCGCSFANFMVLIVLIIQTAFTAATLVYTVNQRRSECMDVAHLHPLLAYRPLMQQISGIQTGITLLISISALIYKKGCLSERVFDNWMIFLKFILSLKQILWTALQTFMQLVIMPLYCSPDIMRFGLILSIANVVSFLLVIAKHVYNCICSRCCS